jgi:hypothetical protein
MGMFSALSVFDRCLKGMMWLCTAWAGLNVQSDTSPPSAPLTFFTFMMLLAPITNSEPHGVTLAGYCYTMRHRMKDWIVTPYYLSHLQRYDVAVHGNITSVYLPLRYVLMLQCVPTVTVCGSVTSVYPLLRYMVMLQVCTYHYGTW